MAVAALVASLLITACPPAEDGFEGGTPIVQNANPSTQLQSLSVVYHGQTQNLVNFDGNASNHERTYKLIAPTAANQSTVTVKAKAKSATAKVQITYTYGSETGGMENGTNLEGEQKLIPIPNTKENTVVHVTVSNVDENNKPISFAYAITITPPSVDTTLKTLKVVLSTDTSEAADFNRIEYNPKVSLYEVYIPNTTPDNANVIVTAEKNDPDADLEISSKTTPIPAAGSTDRKVITVTVEKEGISSTYRINIIPAQSTAHNDSTLQNLQFAYQDGGDDIPAISDFSPDKTDYTLVVDSNNVTTVKLTVARANSSKVKSIVVTQGTTGQSPSPYATSTTWAEDSTDTREITGAQTAIPLPQKGAGVTLTFLITVTAASDEQNTYRVNITNPFILDTYSGTAVVTDLAASYGRVLDHVELVGPNGEIFPSNTITDAAWTAEIDSRIAPVAFNVVFKKTVGGNTTTHKQRINNTFSTKTNINLNAVVANSARIIYSATDLLELGTTGAAGENWLMNNDITLPDSADGWVGPENYHGTFDGNGHTIHNLVHKRTSGATGLFRSVSNGAVIKNFTLEVSTTQQRISMTGDTYFGGVLGRAKDCGDVTIRNVTVTGDLLYGSPSPNASFAVGGLVGSVEAGSDKIVNLNIENCISLVNIEGYLNASANGYENTLGFSAFIANVDGAKTTVRIKDCFAGGSINLITMPQRDFWVGAFAARVNQSDNNARFYLENSCGATEMEITDTGTFGKKLCVGGLVGGFQAVKGDTHIKNSVALNNKIDVNSNYGTDGFYIHRLVGDIPTNQITNNLLIQNLANEAMQSQFLGLTSSNTGINKINGYGVVLTNHDSILQVLNTGYSTQVWEYKTGASLPSLK